MADFIIPTVPGTPVNWQPEPRRRMLTIELVPRTSFYQNLRNMLPTGDWDILRRESYQRNLYRCEICDGAGPNWPVECHEIWDYDDEFNIQTLIGLQSLCPA